MNFSLEDTDKLFEEELTMLILHEVGHTLGLNHNMGATTLHNKEDVHNPEITYKEGLSASVMDYHAINIAPPGVEQGQFSDINLVFTINGQSSLLIPQIYPKKKYRTY